MSGAHERRRDWNKSFENKSDVALSEDIERISQFMYLGPPYGREHHMWVAIRGVLLREARKRGLDPGILAPK